MSDPSADPGDGSPLAPRCILTVHAHPDDESSKGAGTIAKYHDQGVRTVLVCCTGGEEGEILNPAMDRPEVRDNIHQVRQGELTRAAAVIGYDQVELLGYRDSGMAGSEANARPDCFAQAPMDEAIGRLVAIIRRERPQIVITYPDGQNEYPHPDHIRVHDISGPAFEAAGDPDQFPEAGPPFTPAKLYYTVWPRQRMLALHHKFLELGLESPFDDTWLERLNKLPDTDCNTHVELTGYDHIRGDALREHATQIDPTSKFWFGLPPEVQATLHPYDDYRLAASTVGPIDGEEDDLFVGVPDPVDAAS